MPGRPVFRGLLMGFLPWLARHARRHRTGGQNSSWSGIPSATAPQEIVERGPAESVGSARKPAMAESAGCPRPNGSRRNLAITGGLFGREPATRHTLRPIWSTVRPTVRSTTIHGMAHPCHACVSEVASDLFRGPSVLRIPHPRASGSRTGRAVRCESGISRVHCLMPPAEIDRASMAVRSFSCLFGKHARIRGRAAAAPGGGRTAGRVALCASMSARAYGSSGTAAPGRGPRGACPQAGAAVVGERRARASV